MIAMTLIIANQYSKVPNALTARALTKMSTAEKYNNPDPDGYCWQPIIHIECSSSGLAADGYHLGGPVCVADHKASPRPDIEFSVNAE